MPDNRKPLIYGAFPVCRNYTVRAHLRHAVAEKRGGRENTVGALGHYSAGFTLNAYTHATAQMRQDAANTIGGVISQQMR